MKWLVRKGNAPSSKKESFWFEEIGLDYKDGDPKLQEQLKEIGLIEWVTYPGPENLNVPLQNMDRKQTKRKYEIFCGGFLYYHDVEFKKYKEGTGFSIDDKGNPVWKVYPKGKTFEHMVYFEWFKENGSDMIRMYINPTP